jgi:hypothetical protein
MVCAAAIGFSIRVWPICKAAQAGVSGQRASKGEHAQGMAHGICPQTMGVRARVRPMATPIRPSVTTRSISALGDVLRRAIGQYDAQAISGGGDGDHSGAAQRQRLDRGFLKLVMVDIWLLVMNEKPKRTPARSD